MCFFFFQAEDGIRDLTVTGVQTCALPIAALSTYMCSSFTLGYTALIAVTVRRQSCELASTLALSTEHSRWERFSARANAKVAMRSISGVEYDSVSHERSLPASVLCPRSPK